MAVVQISKIQIRRGSGGQQLEGTDPLVKLSSGEFAWGIDTQKLYIGSGTTQEGAPKEENIEVLTKNSDIFTIGQYAYGPVITGPNSPITRSVQQRLDDRVNAKSFGVKGGFGVDNDSEAINRALIRLYKNSLQGSGRSDIRAVLEFGPGIHRLDDPILVYSYTSIIGAGVGRTIFKYTGTGSAFIFVKDTGETVDIGATNQCRFVSMRDFSVQIDNGNTTAFEMNSVKDSVFRNIEFIGTWESDSGIENRNNSIAVNMKVTSSGVTCRDNEFSKVKIFQFKYGVNAKGDIRNNTFRDCKFEKNEISVNFGNDFNTVSGTLNINNGISGQEYGPRYNIITNCFFDRVQKHAIKVWQGYGNVSSKNNFWQVGNNFGGSYQAAYGQVEFDVPGNVSADDYSDRHKELGILNTPNSLSSIEYIPEVTGKSYYANRFTNTTTLNYVTNNSWTNIFRFTLPSSSTSDSTIVSCSIEVDYIYNSLTIPNPGNATDYLKHRRLRKGKMNIMVDSRTSNATLSLPRIHLIDEYDYIGIGSKSLELTNVQIAGTQGQFTCDASPYPLTTNMTIMLVGPNSTTGAGSIAGYTPGPYFILSTNGSTSFTLKKLKTDTNAITTSVGTPTATFTMPKPNVSDTEDEFIVFKATLEPKNAQWQAVVAYQYKTLLPTPEIPYATGTLTYTYRVLS